MERIMRIFFFVVSAVIAAQVLTTPASAIEYPWCRSSVDGGTNCGFVSREQCGGGPYCYQNPFYTGAGSSSSASPQPKRRH
jgi:Protein of unknown function (DUF3551)